MAGEKDCNLTVRLPVEEREKFQEACTAASLSMSQAVRMFVEQYTNEPRRMFLLKSIYREEGLRNGRG